ncbi:universal stress protein [Streptomyces fildesensis]|uniref:Universal stress protein n=1 Tax=Streptomyces fildesensis TaxID=375757 RepID=A0ABW8C3H9_9ACTN
MHRRGPLLRLIYKDHSAFSGTFGPSRIRGRQSTLEAEQQPLHIVGLGRDAEQQALAHSATANPDLHPQLQDVSHTLCVSTGARDIDAALVAARTQTRSMPSPSPEHPRCSHHGGSPSARPRRARSARKAGSEPTSGDRHAEADPGTRPTCGRGVDEVVANESERLDRSVEVPARVVEGHPAEVLLAAAAGAQLLTVGTRGHGTFAGILLGSVSQHCVQHAPCPVVVVPE